MAAGGGEDVGWTYCLDGDGAVYILGRREALLAFGHTYLHLICLFGLDLEWEEK